MHSREHSGKHPVLRHRQRQARITHDQGIEHAEAAHHSAQHDGDAQPVPANQAGKIRPRARLECRRRNAGHVDRQNRQDITQGDNNDGCNHRSRIGSLRPVHLARDCRSVVPAHVVPHGDEYSAEQTHRRMRRRRPRQRPGLERRQNYQRCKRRRKQKEKSERRHPDHADVRQIQRHAYGHHADAYDQSAVILRKVRDQTNQIRHEQRGVNGHVEYAGGQGLPRFLKAPKISHCPAHPHVVPAFFGQRAGQFADHQRRWQAP